MAEIRPCTVDDILGSGLIPEYAYECRIAGLPAPDPDRKTYRAMESTGFIKLFGAYIGDVMVGFASVMVNSLPHYSRPVAVTESIFVSSTHRKSGAGLKLLRQAEQYAKNMGAVGILVSAPAGGKFAAVLERTAYRHTNQVYFRGFDE